MIHLDEGEPLEVALEALETARIGAGERLTPQRRHLLLDADASVRVHEAALHLLSHRARTRQELRRRLRQKGFGAALIEPCLERLSERGLLDDAAVAAAFVRDRLRHRPRGRARLVSELRAKGVGADLARETIDGVFEDEETSDMILAREAARAWIRRQAPDVRAMLASESPTPERAKARRRLYGYLARRGFVGDAVAAAMELLADPDGD